MSASDVTELEHLRPDIAALYDRLSRAIEKNGGIQLSAAEVDLVVLTGGFAAISKTLSALQRKIAQERLAAAGIVLAPDPES